MIIITKTYTIKFVLDFSPKYAWISNNECINLKTGRTIIPIKDFVVLTLEKRLEIIKEVQAINEQQNYNKLKKFFKNKLDIE